MSANNQTITVDLSAPVSPTRTRLIQGFVRLQNIQFLRVQYGEAGFAMASEDQIVWRELLDLELQDIDEQMARISSLDN